MLDDTNLARSISFDADDFDVLSIHWMGRIEEDSEFTLTTDAADGNNEIRARTF